jgi:hypothetical protein
MRIAARSWSTWPKPTSNWRATTAAVEFAPRQRPSPLDRFLTRGTGVDLLLDQPVALARRLFQADRVDDFDFAAVVAD